MPIPQLAGNPNAQPLELVLHADNIHTRLASAAQESRQIGRIALTTCNLALALIDELNAVQNSGATHIVCENRNGVQLSIRDTVGRLEAGAGGLFEISQQMNRDVQAYERQLETHGLLMSTNMSNTPLQRRVIACEQEAIRITNQQRHYLEQNLQAIDRAEGNVIGVQYMLGDNAVVPLLTNASLRLWERLG